jgi:ArsR family transcriptional regulator
MPALADPHALRSLAGLFRALSDETRLRIVALLVHGELCVCHLQEALALTQPNISRHLAVLRAAGVVADRRAGSFVHYRLAPQADRERQRIVRALAAGFVGRADVQRGVTRLKRTCGPDSGAATPSR